MSADLLLGLPAKVKQLLDRLTEARATKLDNLDNLDTAVSTRAPSSDTGTLLGRLTQPRAENLDRLPKLALIGPPSGAMSFPEDRFTTVSNVYCRYIGEVTEVDVPNGAGLTEILSLAGPGIIHFLAISISATTNVSIELTIDGVAVTPLDMNNSMGGTRCYSLIGALVGELESASAPNVLAFQPTAFMSSLVLKATHDHSLTRAITACHRHMPV